MEPSQSAWVAWVERMLPPPPVIVRPLSEKQVTLKLPPPALEKLPRMLVTFGAAELEASSGPKTWVAPAAKVTKPVVADKLIKGLAAERMPFNPPRELPKNRSVVPVALVV